MVVPGLPIGRFLARRTVTGCDSTRWFGHPVLEGAHRVERDRESTMSTARFGRGHKAMALVPLAVLSAAWTASIAGVGGVTVVSADASPETTLPDGSSVPTEAIEAPASVSAGGGVSGGIAPGLRG